ncbi:PEPxxWA-CTERM sorting domain-containing protein [Sphingomonas sp. 1P08PE]|uniref:PEPxxWA-CTERM sorting domain-containing protein n=1 Tax=Sphingomonas sp. 1P08PE TaxID=554122 RepID=UPI0039A038EF
MTKTTTRLLAAAILCALPATANAAATLKIENGKLTGASGVVVDGKTYDVTFADGKCATVYGKCDASNFTFTTRASATLAAQALLDQVFLDGSAGAFDSDPALTAGCSFVSSCESYIAYATGPIGTYETFEPVVALNTKDRLADEVVTYEMKAQKFFDTAPASAANFALFTPTAAVPEPATWALMLAGFGLTATALRRRRVRFAGAAA